MGRTTRPVLVALLALVLGLAPVSPGTAADDTTPNDPACLEHPIALPGTRAEEESPLAPCTGIGPGGGLILRAGPVSQVYCTMGFIVSDGTELYVSTAGHCVDPDLGVPGPGKRVAAHGVPGEFGTVAYQWCEGGDVLGNGCAAGTDFALIRIDRDKHHLVRRQMCTWGAAAGLFTTKDANIRQLRHFGWGLGLGNPTVVGTEAQGTYVQPGNPATQARLSHGLDFTRPSTVIGHGPAISGDSGSGVLVATGAVSNPLEEPAKALGILTHIGAGGVLVVQRMDASLARASADTGKVFTLG